MLIAMMVHSICREQAEWLEYWPMVWETGVQSEFKSYQRLKKWLFA